MSSSGLQAGFAFAIAVPILVLVVRIWIILTVVLLIFQDGFATFTLTKRSRLKQFIGGASLSDRCQAIICRPGNVQSFG
jgi:hypothetical protein